MITIDSERLAIALQSLFVLPFGSVIVSLVDKQFGLDIHGGIYGQGLTIMQ